MAPIEAIDFDGIYGNIFVLRRDGDRRYFHPYEYHTGLVPDVSGVSSKFLSEFADFLDMNGLEDVLGLQILDDLPEMWEFVFNEGSVMLEPARVKGGKPTRQTGWRFKDEGGNPRVCQDGRQFHGTYMDGSHITAVTKLDRKPGSFEFFWQGLQECGIVS